MKKGAEQAAGFTLIELLIVLFLLATMATMVVPRLFPDTQEKVRNEAIHFSRVLEWVSDAAMYTGKRHQLQLDLENSSYQLLVEQGESLAPVTETMLKPRKLDPEVIVVEWWHGGEEELEEITEIDFTAVGSSHTVALTFRAANEDDRGFVVQKRQNATRVEMIDLMDHNEQSF